MAQNLRSQILNNCLAKIIYIITPLVCFIDTICRKVKCWKGLPQWESLLHSWLSWSSPWQSSPPYCGAGESHCLLLVWFPSPQILSQSLHSVHSPQLPFTEIVEIEKIYLYHYLWWGCPWLMGVDNAVRGGKGLWRWRWLRWWRCKGRWRYWRS